MYAAFCDYCGDFSQSLNLCGLSLGAVLALNYAIDFPQRVNSLILIAPQYDMPKFLIESFSTRSLILFLDKMVNTIFSVSKKLESFRESSAHWRGNPPVLRLNLSISGLKSWEIATPGKRTGSQ